jgi:hypothetical protein
VYRIWDDVGELVQLNLVFILNNGGSNEISLIVIVFWLTSLLLETLDLSDDLRSSLCEKIRVFFAHFLKTDLLWIGIYLLNGFHDAWHSIKCYLLQRWSLFGQFLQLLQRWYVLLTWPIILHSVGLFFIAEQIIYNDKLLSGHSVLSEFGLDVIIFFLDLDRFPEGRDLNFLFYNCVEIYELS